MTTDLTDGSELSEEEFDWDVFAPDPDESEMAADAATFEDEGDLNLDDSDLDWEAALREPEEARETDGEARAGAAYDRIVDTVRRSVQDPESEAPVVEAVVVEGSIVEVPPAKDVVVETDGVGGDDGARTEDSTIVATLDPETAHATEVSWLDFEDDAHDGDGGRALGQFDAGPESPTEPEPGPWVPVSAMTPFEPLADDDVQGHQTPPDAPSWHEPDAGWEPASEPASEPQAPDVMTFAPGAATALAAPAWTTETLEPEVEAAPPVAPALPEATDEIEPDEAAAPEQKRRDRKKGQQPKDREREPRSRVFTATVILACIVLVLLAGVVAVRSIRHPATTTPAAKAAPHPAARVAPSPDAARMQSATDAVDSATTAAQVGLTSLGDFATPSNVAKVIYPYIASLQLYESVLAGSDVPRSAHASAASASAQVRQELSFLDTISTLPPAQLGAYLQQFGTEATQLQATLSALEQELTTGS